MAYRYDAVFRIEPEHTYADLARGLAAEVADPAWFLGRQWQLGEHHGEDAASPVRVEYRAGHRAIRPVDGRDPRVVPAEAIIESEPDDFWTPGRRVAIGRAVAQAAEDAGRPLPDDPGLPLAKLPTPYDLLDGTGPDGFVLFRRRHELALPDEWFPELPPRPAPRDRWNSAELAYDADFRAGDTTLALRRHDGGEVDWWSVDATAPLPDPDPLPEPESVLATRIQYPGAPHPRWWQIEEARTDIGGYASDRGHFATLLLVELVTSHSDDWFTFPVTARPGEVLTLHEVTVLDSFGDRWTISPPADGWTMFAVTGLDPRSMVLWPTAATPLTGPVTDQVDLGVDEDANAMWAVERRIHGRDVPSPPRTEPSAPAAEPPPPGPLRYAYLPGIETPPNWHPYVIPDDTTPRRLVQARLADLTATSAAPMDLPTSDLLRPTSAEGGGVHRIEPAAVPVDGLQIERRYQLSRATNGRPVLWQQRRRIPLADPPIMRLVHDALQPD